jgi:hypothetical protein
VICYTCLHTQTLDVYRGYLKPAHLEIETTNRKKVQHKLYLLEVWQMLLVVKLQLFQKRQHVNKAKLQFVDEHKLKPKA